jgi:hypothetical protein
MRELHQCRRAGENVAFVGVADKAQIAGPRDPWNSDLAFTEKNEAKQARRFRVIAPRIVQEHGKLLLRGVATAVDDVALRCRTTTAGRRIAVGVRGQHRADLQSSRMIQPQRLLGERLLFRTVIPEARDIFIGALPCRQPHQRLIMEARHDNRLRGKRRRHVICQAEQIRTDDQCIEIGLPPPQDIDERRRVNGMAQVLLLDVRGDSPFAREDGLHRL